MRLPGPGAAELAPECEGSALNARVAMLCSATHRGSDSAAVIRARARTCAFLHDGKLRLSWVFSIRKEKCPRPAPTVQVESFRDARRTFGAPSFCRARGPRGDPSPHADLAEHDGLLTGRAEDLAPVPTAAPLASLFQSAFALARLLKSSGAGNDFPSFLCGLTTATTCFGHFIILSGS
jgi:hypothetical protein